MLRDNLVKYYRIQLDILRLHGLTYLGGEPMLTSLERQLVRISPNPNPTRLTSSTWSNVSISESSSDLTPHATTDSK